MAVLEQSTAVHRPTTRELLTQGDVRRKLTNRVMTGVVGLAFLIALIPLVSLSWTVVGKGV